MSPYRAVPRRHLATSPFDVPDPAPPCPAHPDTIGQADQAL